MKPTTITTRFHPVGIPTGTAVTVLALTVVALALMHLMDFLVLRAGRERRAEPRPGRLWGVLRHARAWGFWLLLVVGQALCLLIGEPSNEFIYFQF